MMKRIYFAAFAAALALTGCSKAGFAPDNGVTPEHNYPVTDQKQVELTVNVSDLAMNTKITGKINDGSINTLQVFVFNKHGLFETSASTSGSQVTFSCTAGSKTIVTLVNAKTETGVTTLEEFSARKATLETTNQNNCVMVGSVKHDVVESGSVLIPVTRLAAMVGLRSVALSFTAPYLRTLPFAIKSVYLINAAGDRAYIDTVAPDHIYNVGALDEDNTLDILYDAVAEGSITSGGQKYETDHYFYCYPNSSSALTRLVIEAELDGDTYYYPIELSNITSNNKYLYDVTIKGLGKDSPDILLSPVDLLAAVTVNDWVDTTSKVEL